jgi:hypothetical protein
MSRREHTEKHSCEEPGRMHRDGDLPSQLEERTILDTRRTHGLARAASKASIDVDPKCVTSWIEAPVDHRAHEVESSTR